MPVVLSAAAIVSAALAIVFDHKDRRLLVYVFKPLTIVLIMLVGVVSAEPGSAAYRTFILAGLAASLAGDILLMLPKRPFAAGLACFLVAHGFYILAFRPSPGHRVTPVLLLPFIILGLLVFRTLAPVLGRMKFPVLIYVAAITAMACLAAARFVDLGGSRTLFAFAGATLFLVSDSVLAYNRFVRPFSAAQFIILGTYFPAQLLIALSV